jgi:hypothetical protein
VVDFDKKFDHFTAHLERAKTHKAA